MSARLELARSRMIQHQIRAWDVLDQRVLEAFSRVPRERFVPASHRNLAFADINIPIGHGEVMMAPKVEGRLLTALELTPDDEILEIGTGSGFLAACLAFLGGSVRTIDIHEDLVAGACSCLEELGCERIAAECLDASGLDEESRYDAIAVTASLPVYDKRFQNALKPRGRLFVIVGEGPAMDARRVTRVGDCDWVSESLFETEIPPLANAARPPAFEF